MRQVQNEVVETLEKPAGRSRLLSRLYHEIGLAAVALELDVEPSELPAEEVQAIRRGARYLNLELLDLAS
jgi:hypothetical protein